MYGISIPADSDGLNAYNSMRSVAGRVQNDLNTQFYMRALYQRATSGTTFGLPRAWRRGKRYFKNVLFSEGFIGVINSPQYGKIPQICTFSGYGIFKQPVRIYHVQGSTSLLVLLREFLLLHFSLWLLQCLHPFQR